MTTVPEVYLYNSSEAEDEAGHDLARKIEGLGILAPFVLHSVHGKTLAEKVRSVAEPLTPERSADQDWAMRVGADAKRAGADAIVSIGGGRLLDVGKLAAARAGMTTVAVPTQLSHDGLCSPVAVVPNAEGRTESLGAIEPRAVYLSMPTLVRAPATSLAAGLGDLLANPLALRDWALAAEHGHETIQQRAWDLSLESFQTIQEYLDTPPTELVKDTDFIRNLANALILSGVAMIEAGTSRPASGGEHEISHAIDYLYGGRALHGAQVAFGCIFSVALYGEDTGLFRERLERLGLPSGPEQLGLSLEDTVEVLLEAPETRPGRFTIIEDANLDRASATALVRKIWAG